MGWPGPQKPGRPRFLFVSIVNKNKNKNSSRTRRKPESINSSRTRRKPESKSKASAAAAGEIVKGQQKAAKYAGVSMRSIRRWVQAGMPRTEGGHYFKKMLDFYANNEGSQPTEAKKKGQTADAEYKDAKARLMQLKTNDHRQCCADQART